MLAINSSTPVGNRTVKFQRGRNNVTRKISWRTDNSRATHHDDRFIYSPISIPNIDHGEGDLLAVMDGHSGPKTAEVLERNFAKIFSGFLRSSHGDVEQAHLSTYTKLADMMRWYDSGSTLSSVYIPHDEDRAYAAVIGDSPVIIGDKNNEAIEGPLHNARSNFDELLAAIKRGAYFRNNNADIIGGPFHNAGFELKDIKTGGDLEIKIKENNISLGSGYLFNKIGNGLQLTRSLGDRSCGFLLREPELFQVDFPLWVFLASDGITSSDMDSITGRKTVLIELLRMGANAESLVANALYSLPDDEVTAIVYR